MGKMEGLRECLPNGYPRSGGLIVIQNDGKPHHSQKSGRKRKKPVRRTSCWWKNYGEV